MVLPTVHNVHVAPTVHTVNTVHKSIVFFPCTYSPVSGDSLPVCSEGSLSSQDDSD